MHYFFMTTKDVIEALGVGAFTARKMMKEANDQIIAEGYTLPSSYIVHIKKFCEVHNLDYDKLVDNINEVRSKRGKYSRTSPM